MAYNPPFKITSISQLHQLRGFPKPEHPLISVIDIAPIKQLPGDVPKVLVTDFYFIALKRCLPPNTKMKYGHQEYDFDEGVLSFMAPGQIFGFDPARYDGADMSGWVLLVHPDFLWKTSLARKIRQYPFFDYSVTEALFLSEKEEATVTGLIHNIQQEYRTNIDQFSQDITISLIESLLNYADRFYHRQFITRKISNHTLVDRLDQFLETSLTARDLTQKGIPTVKYISSELNVSPNYLTGLLKMLTGKTTQQYIQDKIIEKAKDRLSTTDLSISEIAYELGFVYPQSFSKLFKLKTNLSPLEFRQSFN
ncbi:helix-turn-helix transcriptional regulator [Flavitalea sp. BT771]|uniref:helix-turn-helix domain-containing protein n=1 Tax=Flavitalea sp. BT771 TaxID=3063329 RepID=UPI0026E40CDD|nr:AraC family transcriptional regulator [Flavitalea sp. BT771]MDO6435196.1 helix-turn-helix transcriptional regulator [Flavitalea sp. BT771]MDV6224099.1 helix-turn-helix transcriptional regulator [Flavitalea sp. BT771]